MNHLSELAALNIVACLCYESSAAVLVSSLHYSLIFFCSLNHFSSLPDAKSGCLLKEDIFSCLACPYCGKCMPVIGSGYPYGINIFVVHHLLHITGGQGLISQLLFDLS